MLKGQRYPAVVLTEGEVNSLLSACGQSRTGKRNRALLILLYRAGLRVAEATCDRGVNVRAIRPQDVNWQTGEIRVRHGAKNGNPRTTGVSPEALAALREWRDARSKLSLPGDAPLICTLRGEPLKHQYVQAMLRRLALKAGVEKRVHAHGLRHTFAHELVNEGAPLNDVRDLLGHTSAVITDQYLRNLGASPAVARARTRTWRPAGGDGMKLAPSRSSERQVA